MELIQFSYEKEAKEIISRISQKSTELYNSSLNYLLQRLEKLENGVLLLSEEGRKVRVCEKIAMIYENSSKMLEAIKYYQICVEICKGSPVIGNLIRGYMSKLGHLSILVHDYDKAIEYLKKAAVIETNPLQVGSIYYQISSLFETDKKYELSLKWFQKSLTIRSKLLAKEDSLLVETRDKVEELKKRSQ